MTIRNPAHRALPCALLGAIALTACASVAPAARQSSAPFEAVWQRHQTTINYVGFTAQYSCDGFEEKVRTILLYLGARRDLKVQQVGCNRAFDQPGHIAAVRADFYTLSPASATGADTVNAQWTMVTIKPMDPYWMDFGECELMQQIKPVIAGDYSVRDLHYRTACVPHDTTISDFDLHGQFPKLAASPSP
ncbi:MAG TPA: hypothetical protein VN660_07765 [Steroidobacteraceae bacterium]|nr:hypothetical protein [Steroidobacteraceae bacterium]